MMNRAREKGYDKFTEMAQNIFRVVDTAKKMRSNINVFCLWHIEKSVDAFGNSVTKAKTQGKMFDQNITLEGLFTYVLITEIVRDDKGVTTHHFVTKNDGSTTVKTPKGMFEDKYIPNDLQFVLNKINEYENE